MPAPTLKTRIGYASDKGIKEDNEDFVGSLIPEGHQLLYKGISAAIADGMSGSEGGKQASHCCVASFFSDYYSTPDSWSVRYAAEKILSATNSWLYSQGQSRFQSIKGMVSTLSILILKSNTAHIFHVGDSRIYRFRDGVLEQITRDHRVWVSHDKSYLSRAMGVEPRLEVDYHSLPVLKGDLFLMATDGVHDFVDDKSLRKELQTGADLNEIAGSIIRQAVLNHSDDNLTCQLIAIDELPRVREDEVLRRHGDLPFPPPLEPGMTIDGFRIEKELHASKRTQIYLAYDRVNDVRVILKTPSILYDDDSHYIEHFLHEEWAGRRLDHENIVKVSGFDRKKSCLYYVTEYLEGPTLREWMKENPKADIRDARNIIEQVARGLRAFQRMEMLHQDLKPENIMFAKDGTVKIIDFGSVRISGITEITPLIHAVGENILGTLNYTAPEYHLGLGGTAKSDLYSLGVIAYELINGALPYGKNMPEKPGKSALQKLRYVPSIHCNPMVPIWIDGALKKATSIAPEYRYDHLSEFLFDLSTPNPLFLRGQESVPLIEQNPLQFWKGLCLISFIANIVMVYCLMR
ncbi:MAG: protein kinase domain-containing protein [Gammaproteobacteria bacterium]